MLYLLGETVSFTSVTQGVTDIMSVVSTLITTILGNPVLVALLAAGFVSIGLRIFRRMKRTASSN